MNKAEKERMVELETALALHWPSYAEPRPMTREEIEAAKVDAPLKDTSVYKSRPRAFGWFYNAHNGQITEGWSDGISHCRHGRDGSASQEMGRMYRTREEAAKAMRLEMSRHFATRLSAVDRVIRGEA